MTLTERQVENLFDQLKRIESDQRTIRLAVIGDQQYGHPGLIKRMADAEGLAEKQSKAIIAMRTEMRVAGAIATTAVAVVAYVKDIFSK